MGAAVWAVLAAVFALGFFVSTPREVVLATHTTTVLPRLDGEVLVQTGPVLPDVRLDAPGRVGASIRLGDTDAEDLETLLQRYAVVVAQPEGQVGKLERALRDAATVSAVRGGALAVVPIGVWVLVGRRRRADLLRRFPTFAGVVSVAAAAGVALLLVQPWGNGEVGKEKAEWMPLADFLGPAVTLPEEMAGVQVRQQFTTSQTRRLIASAVDTYDRSRAFYRAAAEDAADLDLRRPEEDEAVVVLVSDRHDNVGMDEVARAIGDAADASAVLNAGDDTSVGRPWEAFSLDSVSEAFSGYDRFGVTGNHDHGTFVRDYLSGRGWTMLDGRVTEGPAGSRLLGMDDPRASGLGNWRDEPGPTFAEVTATLGDAACDAVVRVNVMLVHDVDLGNDALRRGCVDLVVGGHDHVRSGPTAVLGDDDRVGFTYTNGTTGGAAYAIAMGSKPRRPAMVSLITLRDGRPVGIQSVTVQTTGRLDVSSYADLGALEVLARGPAGEPEG